MGNEYFWLIASGVFMLWALGFGQDGHTTPGRVGRHVFQIASYMLFAFAMILHMFA